MSTQEAHITVEVEASATQILGIMISFLNLPLLHSFALHHFLPFTYMLLYLAAFSLFP